MTVPVWQPGTIYLPGDVVQPATAPIVAAVALSNPGFESGTTDWTMGSYTIDTSNPFAGTNYALCIALGTQRVIHTSSAVVPGTSITASCMFQQGSAPAGKNVGAIVLIWYTSGMAEISVSEGNYVTSNSGGVNGWKPSTVTASAPSGAAFVAVGGQAINQRTNGIGFDAFSWNYVPSVATETFIYQAVQAAAGSSGTSEPVWPVVLLDTVVDNQVTWQAVHSTRLEWTASSILTSGATEPMWPTASGDSVSDNTIAWVAVVRNVDDAKCPNTKVVAILADKVYCGDDDIVAFSATTNPLDWSTVDDAGFLPTGLQQFGANPMAVLQPYRGNLACFNSQGLQMWQVDQDPARMALLDAFPVGSTYYQAASPVSNDLLFLTRLGVRTVGIAASSTNLAAGDIGEPVDSLVQFWIRRVEDGYARGFSTYFPSQGQYWLCFTYQTPNYITWDADNDIEVALTNGDLTGETISDVTATRTAYVFGTLGQSTGLHYYTVTIDAFSNIEGEIGVGLALADAIPNDGDYTGIGGFALISSGLLSENQYETSATTTFTTGDVVVVAYNADLGYAWIGKVNGAVVDYEGGGDPATSTVPTVSGLSGTYLPYFVSAGPIFMADATITANFGATAFSPTEPNYYVGWYNGQFTPSGPSEVFVHTISQLGEIGAWTRYIFPWPIAYFTQLGNDLYARAGDTVYRFDTDIYFDDQTTLVDGDVFESIIQWGYLDFGLPGVTKQMIGFDMSGTGTASVQFGYDQRNLSTMTTAWTVDIDTLPGSILPMPIAAPTISVKLTFAGGEAWEWQSFVAYFNDFRLTS